MFFDPLGLISPVVLQAKLIFKQLCLEKSGWDDVLEESISKKWKKFLKNLEDVHFHIERHMHLEGRPDEVVELHGFSDASIQAYAAVVYLRIIKGTEVKMILLTSKSKVAPMKKYSIPRLELLSCLLLAKLIKAVISAFGEEVAVNTITTWTDSEISYYWLTQVHKEWNTWVENRVGQIRGIVPPSSWRHVPGTKNPADLATRELNPEKLMECSLWWYGPTFLHETDSEWPDIPAVSAISSNLEEKGSKPGKKSSTNVLTVNIVPDVTDVGEIIKAERYSSLDKLLRVTAYVIRFVKLLKQRICPENVESFDPEITTEEIMFAENLWIRSEQSKLKKEENFVKREMSLRIYEDDQGVLRSRTRISENLKLNFNERHPIILRKLSHLTKLIVWKSHENVKHLKLEATLNDVRTRFWIVQGRRVVRSILRNCTTCNKLNSRPLLPPPSPDLPAYRVSFDVPFEVTGVDFAGPLYTKNVNEKRSKKCYILLFTCAATRLVHLEITSDLSAEPLILALRRFTARRGSSKMYISDNFKTFKSSDVKAFLRNKRIKWQFILDKAPNWGGFYEKMIGITKSCLKKTIGQACLSMEELYTVMMEVENVLNSRPLTYLCSENFQESLTPNHLLYGRSLNQRNESSTVETQLADDLRGRVRHVQTVLNHFHQRFYKEYITSLREKHQYIQNKTTVSCPARVGEVVLIKEDVKPRIRWRKGKIEELIVGADGRTRGATLRVYQERSNKTTLINRPLQRIIPLEVHDLEEMQVDKLVPDINESNDHTTTESNDLNDPTKSNDSTVTESNDLNDSNDINDSKDTNILDDSNSKDFNDGNNSNNSQSNDTNHHDTTDSRRPRRKAAINANLRITGKT